MKIIGQPRAFRLARFSPAPALKKTPTAERNDCSASISTALKVVSHNIYLKEYLTSASSRREPLRYILRHVLLKPFSAKHKDQKPQR